MGNSGSEKGHAGDFVLDAGALIAAERGSRELIAVLGGAAVLGCRIVVPASVLAQVWRGGSRSAVLARLIEASEVDPLTEKRAKEVGVRLAHRDASDISDAHVVCCASEHRATVVTSDSDDLKALAEPGERLDLIAV